MKPSRMRKRTYSRLIHKVFFQMILMIILAVTFVFAVRLIGRGYIGDAIVAFMTDQIGISYESAYYYYQFYIRNNIENMMIITAIIFFILFFRIAIRWFMKYFDYIVEGVDKLVEESEDRIEMPSELRFMEDKLNQVKDTLEKRTNASKEAEQRKNDLVVYLAHDIKTPLTSIIGYLSLLDEVPDMPGRQRAKYVHITLEKAVRLETLINEFFDITRYNLQNIELEKKEIDLYYMLVQMIEEFYPLLEPNGKKAVLHADENIAVYADPIKLARVFHNILKNAIAYGDTNSIIDIMAQEQEENVMIVFRNHGNTIPKEKLDIIFDKFFRLDESRTSNNGGSGLGLAIAKEIVVLHGGTITAESTQGITSFTVRLPKK